MRCGVFAVMYSHEWITLPAQGRDIWAYLIACVEEMRCTGNPLAKMHGLIMFWQDVIGPSSMLFERIPDLGPVWKLLGIREPCRCLGSWLGTGAISYRGYCLLSAYRDFDEL